MWLGEMGRLPVGQSRPSIIYFRPGPLVYLNAPSGVIILRLKRPMVKGLFRSCLVADLSMAIIGLSLATGPTKAGWPFQFGPSLGSRIHRKMILKRFAETMPNLLQEYRDDGYFIVDDAVEKDLLEELGQALRRAADKVRSGAVVEHAGAISTMGKGTEPHILMGLMAPEYGEPCFAQYLVCEALQKYARLIIGPEQRLGWVVGFATRQIANYDSGWHRDTGGQTRNAAYEEEMEILRTHRKNMLKFHLAVEDDPCLWLVPGSHRRYRSAIEHEFLTGERKGDLPGTVQMDLKRGQTVFWNGNTIHRGIAPAGMVERWNLTGSLVRHENDREELDERFKWRLADKVRDSLPAAVLPLYDNWRYAVEAADSPGCDISGGS